MKITSAGIIRNADKPRIGIIAANGSKLVEWLFEDIDQGIDLTWEEFAEEMEAKAKRVEEDNTLTEEERALALDEIEMERDHACFDVRTVLFGDAWIKGPDGKYDVDQNKEFAAVYNSDSGNIAVEWSKYTTPCHHTSPCYVMADGSGPCGDLDHPGDSVIAYTLPPKYFAGNEEE